MLLTEKEFKIKLKDVPFDCTHVIVNAWRVSYFKLTRPVYLDKTHFVNFKIEEFLVEEDAENPEDNFVGWYEDIYLKSYIDLQELAEKLNGYLLEIH